MTDQELIQSGDLEAYVCGVLSKERSVEISARLKGNKVLREEVEKIEQCYIKLAQGVAPAADEDLIFDRLIENLGSSGTAKEKSGVAPWLGWAAAIALLLVSGYLYTNLNGSNALNENLNNQMTNVKQEKQFLESEIDDLESKNNSYEEAIAFIRDKNTVKVNLAGQGDFENTSAVAFYNAQRNVTYLDIADLPEAPDDKTYQLWSLTFDPLTPTSLGVIEKEDVLLKIDNANSSEGFGITLENAGGSATPNLDQLYTLGVIKNES